MEANVRESGDVDGDTRMGANEAKGVNGEDEY